MVTKTAELIERKRRDIDANKVSRGDIMKFTYWAKVDKKTRRGGENVVEVEDVYSGDSFQVIGDALINVAESADQYAQSEKVRPTEIARIFVEDVGQFPFTVEFIKADGSRRTLRGRILSTSEKLRGYVQVEDLDINDSNKRMRQVDTRTVKTLVFNNKRYTT